LADIFRISCEQKPLKNFGEKGAWAYSGSSQIFGVTHIISGTRKATNFKFGRYIHSVHPNKSPLKIWEKRERGPIQGLHKFLEYPLLSQERVKLRTSNLADVFRASVRTKAPQKFGRKGSVGISRDFPNFSSTPLLYQERVATNFKFGRYVQRSIRAKVALKFGRKGSVSVFRDGPNFLSTPDYLRNG